MSIEAIKQARDILQQAIEQAEKQEPVPWEQFYPDMGKPFHTLSPQIAFNADIVGYVASQRQWVGLTDVEREEIALEVSMDAVLMTESKLKEKNT